MEEFRNSWPAFRGRAIEPVVRDSLERLLPDPERFGAARYAGGYWNRTGAIEVDLVGGDAWPVAKRGLLRRLGQMATTTATSAAPTLRSLPRIAPRFPAPARRPCCSASARAGLTADAGLDVRLSPEDLVDAWRD